MTRQEFNDCINELSECFSGFRPQARMIDKWFEKLKKFSKSDVWKAIDNWTNASLRAPSLSDIEEGAYLVNQKTRKTSESYGSRDGHELEKLPQVIEFRKTSKIEFCMDVLGVETVTEEIKRIVGDGAKWSDLLAKKDWIPLYNAKLHEMFLTAAEFDPVQYRRRFREIPENVTVVSFIEKTENETLQKEVA